MKIECELSPVRRLKILKGWMKDSEKVEPIVYGPGGQRTVQPWVPKRLSQKDRRWEPSVSTLIRDNRTAIMVRTTGRRLRG